MTYYHDYVVEHHGSALIAHFGHLSSAPLWHRSFAPFSLLSSAPLWLPRSAAFLCVQATFSFMAVRLNISWAVNNSDSVRETSGKVSYVSNIYFHSDFVFNCSGKLDIEYVMFQSTDHVECKKGFHNWTNKWIHRNFQTSASPQDSDHISQFGQYFVKQEGRAGQEKYDLYWGNTWHLLVEDNSFDYENKNKEMKIYWGLTLRTFREEGLAE